MENVLKAAEETLEGQYTLKAMGDDFDRAVVRVAEVMGMSAEQVTAFGKSPPTVRSRL